MAAGKVRCMANEGQMRGAFQPSAETTHRALQQVPARIYPTATGCADSAEPPSWLAWHYC